MFFVKVNGFLFGERDKFWINILNEKKNLKLLKLYLFKINGNVIVYLWKFMDLIDLDIL